jgi:two-component system, LytTR family, sensor kinase
MNPHFLFNALNTVAALVRTAPARAERVIENLSEVLRLTLAHSQERTTTVAREAAYVRAWLAIEQERWGDRLRVRWVIDPEVEDALIPPLLVQPLVENSLGHGMGSRIDGITISICAGCDGSQLVISVEDDGIGFPPSYQERTGIGNLRARLSALHGVRAWLDLQIPGPGSKVTVRLPLERADRAGADR